MNGNVITVSWNILLHDSDWCEFDASLMRSNACEYSSISSNDVTDARDYLWLPNCQLNLEYDQGHNIFTERFPKTII